MGEIPADLQGILWSINLDRSDLQKDKVYIVHQVLMFGSLKDIEWLFSVYPAAEIKRVFKSQPQPIYTKPAFNFIKNFILKLDETEVPEQDEYIKHVY